MEDLRLCDSEYRFMCLVWEMTPVRSGDLVKAAHERLAWKKSTTYTVIKKPARLRRRIILWRGRSKDHFRSSWLLS